MRKLLLIVFLALWITVQAQKSDEYTKPLKAQDYKALAKKAQINSYTGAMIAGVGIVFAGTGYLINLNSTKGQYGNYRQTGATLFIAGGVLFNIGMPIMISNGIKANNNIGAMSVGATSDGLTLSIKL